MAAIRSKDTGPELALRQALRSEGILGYRCHHPRLPGKPDVVFMRWKLAVFVDGAYWHGHPDHFRFEKLSPYWNAKVRRTQERDRLQEQELHKLGYRVLRFWDFEIWADPALCAFAVSTALTALGRPPPRNPTPIPLSP